MKKRISNLFRKYKKKFWPYTVFIGAINLAFFLIVEVIPYIWHTFLIISGKPTPVTIDTSEYIAMGIMITAIIYLIYSIIKRILNNDLDDNSTDGIAD